MAENKNTTRQEIETLRTDVKLIMENHLPHLDTKVAVIQAEVKLLLWIAATTLGAVIVTLVGVLFKNI